MSSLFSVLWLSTLISCGGSGTPGQPQATKPPAHDESPSGARATPEHAPGQEPYDSLVESYRKGTEQLIGSLSRDVEPKTIDDDAHQLTRLGAKMVQALRIKNPDCADYFDAVTTAAETLREQELSVIEEGYHADGMLPKAPSGACYHGKDLVVHPATVSALARAQQADWRANAQAEMTEVLAHLAAVSHTD